MTPPAPVPAAVPAYGVDVSGWQTAAQVKALVENPTNRFVIVKASQGIASTSSGWPGHRDLAGNKYLGAYHFCEVGHDAKAEADNFLRVVGTKSPPFLALDVEAAVTPDFVLGWLDRVKTMTGRSPIVYTNWAWLPKLRTACSVAQWEQLCDYRFWMAEIKPPGQFSSIDPKPGSTKSPTVVMHQYAYTPDGTGAQIDRDYTKDLTLFQA